MGTARAASPRLSIKGVIAIDIAIEIILTMNEISMWVGPVAMIMVR